MSELTKCLGEALIAVTEDRCRIILHFENGKHVEVFPHGPDSELVARKVHSAGCDNRLPVARRCTCIDRSEQKGERNGD